MSTTSRKAQGTATFPISGISKVRNNDGGTTFQWRSPRRDRWFSSLQMDSRSRFSLVLRISKVPSSMRMAFVDWPDNGQSMPFSILVYDLPDYTSYESYAQIW